MFQRTHDISDVVLDLASMGNVLASAGLVRSWMRILPSMPPEARRCFIAGFQSSAFTAPWCFTMLATWLSASEPLTKQLASHTMMLPSSIPPASRPSLYTPASTPARPQTREQNLLAALHMWTEGIGRARGQHQCSKQAAGGEDQARRDVHVATDLVMASSPAGLARSTLNMSSYRTVTCRTACWPSRRSCRSRPQPRSRCSPSRPAAPSLRAPLPMVSG